MSAFRQAGYAGTSIQDLVDATGVGRGSLYAAFGSKEGLYLAVLDRYREQYAEPIVGLLKEGVNAKAVIREVLVGVVDATVEDGNREACLVVGAATELAHRDLAVRDRLQGTIQSLEDALFELIVRGQAAGELPADRAPRQRHDCSPPPSRDCGSSVPSDPTAPRSWRRWTSP